MAGRSARSVSIYDAKTHFSQLAAEVANNDIEIVVTRHEKPLIRLVPIAPESQPRESGAMAGRIVFAEGWDEFTADEAQDWYGATDDPSELSVIPGS
ncbi:MAG: type II toxin-antitoxin system prevent-host-death family antitoxin [Propionibacteriaceae bacterium]|jgi:prevent-host-death family protein|nr:type II toxin-antitoxin system prevent-host-death family antitoxin [Propionibacteriaceae bacterium]